LLIFKLLCYCKEVLFAGFYDPETCWEEMETEGQDFTNGHATWTSTMSSFMLSDLSNVVSSGERTSSGFKKVHYNSCAKAINEKFQTALNSEQIKNNLETWSIRFAKINRIRKVSGTNWMKIILL
jgi:hypothetical protein